MAMLHEKRRDGFVRLALPNGKVAFGVKNYG
jgi:hypothetical protein